MVLGRSGLVNLTVERLWFDPTVDRSARVGTNGRGGLVSLVLPNGTIIDGKGTSVA